MLDTPPVWLADRWCKDNALSLERCTKALRAGQEIHLAATGAGRQGEHDRMGGERAGGRPTFKSAFTFLKKKITQYY